MSKTYTWHKIYDSINEINFAENGIALINVKGKDICISTYKENIFACAAKCPHASGNMINAHIDAVGNIVCPLHRYKFSLKNGRNTSGEGYFLKIYPLEIRENGIYIGLEEGGIFNWLK